MEVRDFGTPRGRVLFPGGETSARTHIGNPGREMVVGVLAFVFFLGGSLEMGQEVEDEGKRDQATKT